MDDHATRNPFPYLSAADRDLLAQRIAAMDGVSLAQAHRQIDEFMSLDFGPLNARAPEPPPPHCEA